MTFFSIRFANNVLLSLLLLLCSDAIQGRGRGGGGGGGDGGGRGGLLAGKFRRKDFFSDRKVNCSLIDFN